MTQRTWRGKGRVGKYARCVSVVQPTGVCYAYQFRLVKRGITREIKHRIESCPSRLLALPRRGRSEDLGVPFDIGQVDLLIFQA